MRGLDDPDRGGALSRLHGRAGLQAARRQAAPRVYFAYDARLVGAAAEAGLFVAEVEALVERAIGDHERDGARLAAAVAATRIELEVLG